MKQITGADLRAIRIYSRKTIGELAQAAGIKTRKTYMNWEKDIGTPNVNQLAGILEASHLNADAYFKLMFKHGKYAFFDFKKLVELKVVTG